MGAERPLIEARGLTLAAGKRTLVEAFDWQTRAGEFWCVLGPNGAGKTSLLRALAGLSVPPRGEVLIEGQGMAAWERRALARVRGYMAQQAHDAFDSSVQDSVLIGRHPHLAPWAWEGEADVAAARETLARGGLAGYETRRVKSLSGGERQRVSLAALVLQDPRLWLLDEPTSHQDVAQQALVCVLLRDLAARGRAVVAALHDLNLALHHCTHALLLDGMGRASAGPVETMLTARRLSQVFRHPMHELADNGKRWIAPVL